MNKRSPAEDPQPGDIMTKCTAKRQLVREVTKRDGYHVVYKSVGKEFRCWITTWQGWCRDAKVGM